MNVPKNLRMANIMKRVARGAKFLDRSDYSDTWRDKVRKSINIESFNMEDSNFCILGNVMGDYCIGTGELGLNNSEAVRYGFLSHEDAGIYNDDFQETFSNGTEEYSLLSEAWIFYLNYNK